MLSLWVLLAILAAFFTCLRNAAQKHLVTKVDPGLASSARFIFGCPFAIIVLFIIMSKYGLAKPNAYFWLYCIACALAQTISSVCVTYLFKRKNFAVGAILTKSEIAFVPVVSLVLLHEHLNNMVLFAIALSIFGTFLASLAKINISFKNSSISIDKISLLLGCLSGFFFAITTVTVRCATVHGFAEGEPAVLRSMSTLATVLTIQFCMLTIWLSITKPATFKSVKQNLKPCLFIGLMSFTASFCWFLGYTLTSASMVKVVGQSEFIFMLLLTFFYFKEKIKPLEWAGVTFIMLSTFVALIYQ